MRQTLFFLFLLTLSITDVRAQDPLLAERNAIIAAHYGATIFEMVRFKGLDLGANSSVSTKQVNPISLSFEYGIRDYFCLGVVANYASFQATETYKFQTYNQSLTINSSRLLLQVRAIRYLFHEPKFIIYSFFHLGKRFKQTSKKVTGIIDPSYRYELDSYNLVDDLLPLSIEGGVGTKILLKRNWGLSFEAGVMSSVLQAGVFCRFLEKSRKKIDNIGW